MRSFLLYDSFQSTPRSSRISFADLHLLTLRSQFSCSKKGEAALTLLSLGMSESPVSEKLAMPRCGADRGHASPRAGAC